MICLYAGGHPENVRELTGGIFHQGLNGCIIQLATARNPTRNLVTVNLQQEPLSGSGISNCSWVTAGQLILTFQFIQSKVLWGITLIVIGIYNQSCSQKICYDVLNTPKAIWNKEGSKFGFYNVCYQCSIMLMRHTVFKKKILIVFFFLTVDKRMQCFTKVIL